jgi:hypothetical protein
VHPTDGDSMKIHKDPFEGVYLTTLYWGYFSLSVASI